MHGQKRYGPRAKGTALDTGRDHAWLATETRTLNRGRLSSKTERNDIVGEYGTNEKPK